MSHIITHAAALLVGIALGAGGAFLLFVRATE